MGIFLTKDELRSSIFAGHTLSVGGFTALVYFLCP